MSGEPATNRSAAAALFWLVVILLGAVWLWVVTPMFTRAYPERPRVWYNTPNAR